MDGAATSYVQTDGGQQEHAACAPTAQDQSTMPPAQLSDQGSSSRAVIKSGSAVASLMRRARKGFGMTGTKKKRLVLKLDDDSAAASASAGTSEGNNSQETGPETTRDGPTDEGSDSVPWWKLEYQRPPPGHLGAHVVPVAETPTASIFQQMDEASAPNMFAKLRGNAEEELSMVRPTLDDSPGARKRLHPSHETPERAHRRARSDALSALASIPSLLVDSSPTQKRKIRHVHESEPRDLLGAEEGGISKEQKRFREASDSKGNNSRPLFDRQPTVVTPSRLVKPLNEIEIAGEATGSAKYPSERAAASHLSDNNVDEREGR